MVHNFTAVKTRLSAIEVRIEKLFRVMAEQYNVDIDAKTDPALSEDENDRQKATDSGCQQDYFPLQAQLEISCLTDKIRHHEATLTAMFPWMKEAVGDTDVYNTP